MKKKILIAMSGGVDSGVAAFLIKEKGYPCAGATMRLFVPQQENAGANVKCGAAQEAADAKAVAARLGLAHFVFDMQETFHQKVIAPFIATYEAGGTPNPCIACNRHLKFDAFLAQAQQHGYDTIATGHYVRLEERDGWYYLRKAKDTAKDQSYVLYTLTQAQLAHVCFPLGAYTKAEIRTLAAQQDLCNAKKKESQDICFVPDGDYAAFIRSYTGKTYPPGDFVDGDGKALGRHRGIIHYTIGQRKGLGIAFGQPMYVCGKDAKSNTVTLGSNAALFSQTLLAEDFNWLIPNPAETVRCMAKVRYNMQAQPATASRRADGSVQVCFDEPQRAITKGQAVVLYADDLVLGGGTIV